MRTSRGLIAGANSLLDRAMHRPDAVEGITLWGSECHAAKRFGETMSDVGTGGAAVSIYVIRGLLDHATQHGIDAGEICDVVGLDPGVLGDSAARIPVKTFKSIWDEVASRCRDQDFGLHVGAHADFLQGGHVLSIVMRHCPTLREAMDRFCQYHGLMADFSRPKLQCRGTRAAVVLQPRPTAMALNRHFAEAVLASIASMLNGLLDGGIPLIEVKFAHAQPRSVAELKRFFGCPLRFRSPADALVIAREDLSRPLALTDPELLETLDRLIQTRLARLREGGGSSSEVRRWLGRALPRGGRPSIAAVARDLGMSTRQLQSRLKREGTSYQRLLDQVRREIAVGYLKTGDITLCEVAFLLGYSEQSAFNHAFKRWTGSTPGEFLHGQSQGSS